MARATDGTPQGKFIEFTKESVNEDMPLDQSGDFVGWIAMYNGKRVEIKKTEADGLYGAKVLAAQKLNVPKSKMGLLAIQPAHESVEELLLQKFGLMEDIKVGDVVKYSAKFLHNTGQYTGDVPFMTGTVLSIKGTTPTMAEIDWGKGHKTHALTTNLKPKNAPEPFEAVTGESLMKKYGLNETEEELGKRLSEKWLDEGKCDYRDKTGSISCFGGKAEKRVTGVYNDSESDTLSLCSDCAGRVAKDAKSHGYKVSMAGVAKESVVEAEEQAGSNLSADQAGASMPTPEAPKPVQGQPTTNDNESPVEYVRSQIKLDYPEEPMTSTALAFADSIVNDPQIYGHIRSLEWSGVYVSSATFLKQVKVVGDYNNFNPQVAQRLVDKFGDGAKYRLAREQAVVVYVTVRDTDKKHSMDGVKDLANAETVTLTKNPGEIKIWWK
jgi:hypothetical protein